LILSGLFDEEVGRQLRLVLQLFREQPSIAYGVEKHLLIFSYLAVQIVQHRWLIIGSNHENISDAKSKKVINCFLLTQG